MRPSKGIVALACLGLTTTACSVLGDSSDTGASSAGSPSAVAGTSQPGSSGDADSGDGASGDGSAAPSPSTVKPSEAPRCADRIVGRLTPEQKVGQLIMVGLQAGSPSSSVTSLVRDRHVGNVIYLGGWEGTSLLRRTSAELQRSTGKASTGGMQLLIAADQEGGQVWQVRGGGERLPSALQQGGAESAQRVGYGKQIGSLLRSVGVNLNLAPVADTVPESTGKANEPIGKWGRQYGNTPGVVSKAVPDIIRGLHDGGVAATLKHFPGIGRIRGNTDFTTSGIDDQQMTRTDPYLDPFRVGIRKGADLVMVSSARYPKIDADNPALFSSTIIGDVLRRQLFFDGVVITDDVAATAVSGVPAGQRATRFVEAGGDIVLTGRAADAPTMLDALLSKSKQDPAFAKKVDASVRRVVTLKVSRGLASCS